MSRASPCSPIFRPSQNVPAAPIIEPSVASSVYNQNNSGRRATSRTTTKSIPSGRKKMSDESSAAIRTRPVGVRK